MLFTLSAQSDSCDNDGEESVICMRVPVCACVRACVRVCLVPDVCDDEVGGGDEEVADSLEGCADGLVNFSNTGLGDYLRT